MMSANDTLAITKEETWSANMIIQKVKELEEFPM